MPKFTPLQKRVAIATAALLVVGGGAAYAYWISTGEGAGSAATGTSTAFLLEIGEPTGDPLAPGGDPQSIAFTVTNPGDGTQLLSEVEVTVANADGSVWAPVAGCSASDYSVGEVVITPGQIAPGGEVAGTVTLAMNNLAVDQGACQGLAVPLYFTAS